MVKQYELLVIGDPDVDESQCVDEVTKVVSEQGAIIKSQSVWGLRTLAYAIKKKNQGRYVLFELENRDPKKIGFIVRDLRMHESILRFSIVSVKK